MYHPPHINKLTAILSALRVQLKKQLLFTINHEEQTGNGKIPDKIELDDLNEYVSTKACGSEFSFINELLRLSGGCGGTRDVGNEFRDVFHGCILPETILDIHDCGCKIGH